MVVKCSLKIEEGCLNERQADKLAHAAHIFLPSVFYLLYTISRFQRQE
jgi:hypothetical protein